MHRIRGDQNPDMAIIGDTYKLLSNSSYGSVLMDRTKHSNTRYMNNKIKISKVINSPTFKTLEKLEDNLFEVETYKNSVTMDNPIQIGFFILQYAKLRMLEFYYDCLRTYLTDNSFEIIETDTDSIYMAINALLSISVSGKSIRRDITWKYSDLVVMLNHQYGFQGGVVSAI